MTVETTQPTQKARADNAAVVVGSECWMKSRRFVDPSSYSAERLSKCRIEIYQAVRSQCDVSRTGNKSDAKK